MAATTMTTVAVFTLPGMIDEPGSFSGNSSSPRPQRGPLDRDVLRGRRSGPGPHARRQEEE
jgi:hypothetical protein